MEAVKSKSRTVWDRALLPRVEHTVALSHPFASSILIASLNTLRVLKCAYGWLWPPWCILCAALELVLRKNNNGGVPREVGLGDTLSRTDIVQASEIFYM